MHAICGFITRIIFHPTETNAPKKIHSERQIIAKKIKEQKQITGLTFLEQLKIAHQV